MKKHEITERLDHFIEYAKKTKKFSDAGFYKDCKSEVERLQARIAELEVANSNEWIKCSERLPSEADHYLVALSDPEDVGWVTDKAWTAFYNKGGEWDCCEAVEDGQPVTHWMPLPEPPKQDKNQ